MSTLSSEVSQSQCLIAFSDLAGFARAVRGLDELALFHTMSDYFEYLGQTVEKEGGRLIKCIGDAALLLFPEPCADDGVKALWRLCRDGDQWLLAHGIKCSHYIKVHFGPVVTGLVGARGSKCFDVYGHAVNVAATLPSSPLALTAQAFRKLSPQTRKLFKKHTPPITYIPVDDRHKN